MIMVNKEEIWKKSDTFEVPGQEGSLEFYITVHGWFLRGLVTEEEKRTFLSREYPSIFKIGVEDYHHIDRMRGSVTE